MDIRLSHCDTYHVWRGVFLDSKTGLPQRVDFIIDNFEVDKDTVKAYTHFVDINSTPVYVGDWMRPCGMGKAGGLRLFVDFIGGQFVVRNHISSGICPLGDAITTFRLRVVEEDE